MIEYTYELEEVGGEEEVDIKDRDIIQKGGMTRMSIRDIEYTQEQNAKTLKEVEAQHRINKAEKENIERNHPKVLEMTDEELFTTYLYFEKKEFVRMAEEKIEEFNKKKSELDTMLEDIYKQIPELK